jgi:tRNA (cytidine32/uridine32-2'-O)-methyltransferase
LNARRDHQAPASRTLLAASPLDNIVVVLSHTTEPRNIGAAARALKTMGLRRLRLVNSGDPRGAEALAMAHGAEDLLAAAEIHPDIRSAVADAQVTAGTTSRRRQLRKSALLPPEELAALLVAHARDSQVALLFGTERTGLTNEETDLCRYLSVAEMAQPQPSLNLAQAVMVYAWEIRRAWRAGAAEGGGVAAPGSRSTSAAGAGASAGTAAGEGAGTEAAPAGTRPLGRRGVDHPHRGTRLPSQLELDTMYAHLGEAMAAVGYTARERRKFLMYIRHLHMRAGIVDWELQIYHLLARRVLESTGRPRFRGGAGDEKDD